MGLEKSSPSLSPTRVVRSKPFVAVIALLVCIAFLLTAPLPLHLDGPRASLWNFGTDEVDRTQQPKRAYATFLTGTVANASDHDYNNDVYFVATRLLCYQILHAPETRTNQSIPFLVLVTEDVSLDKRDRLAADGATVVPVEYIRQDWIHAMHGYWQDVMTKLRIWELVQYDLILFLDVDTILLRPLDAIFDDPAAAPTAPGSLSDMIRADEAPLPPVYTFAGVPEMQHEHGYPPSEAAGDFPNTDYLNAGFFLLRPSRVLFAYYLSVVALPDRFDPAFPEQNLFNYAHRREGNMPWRALPPTWNMHYPTAADVAGGVASLHDKWWKPEHGELEPLLRGLRWRMEGFYEGVEAVRGRGDGLKMGRIGLD